MQLRVGPVRRAEDPANGDTEMRLHSEGGQPLAQQHRSLDRMGTVDLAGMRRQAVGGDECKTLLVGKELVEAAVAAIQHALDLADRPMQPADIGVGFGRLEAAKDHVARPELARPPTQLAIGGAMGNHLRQCRAIRAIGKLQERRRHDSLEGLDLGEARIALWQVGRRAHTAHMPPHQWRGDDDPGGAESIGCDGIGDCRTAEQAAPAVGVPAEFELLEFAGTQRRPQLDRTAADVPGS